MIARKSFVLVSFQFFMRFIGWIGLVVLARLWGEFAPQALGTIAFAIAFVELFCLVTDLGFNSAHIKRVSEGKDLGTCIGTYAAIKIILTTVMTIGVLTFIYVSKYLLKNQFSDATTESVIFVILAYYIVINLSNIALVTFEGKKEIVKRQLVATSESIVKAPIFIFVALAGASIAGIGAIYPVGAWPSILQPIRTFISLHPIGSLSMTYVFGGLTSLIIGIFFLRKYPIKRPKLAYAKSYFSFALPMMLISFFGVVSLNIDKILIGYFWTSKEVGYYFSTQQILQVVLVFSGAVGVVLFPTLSEYHARNDLENIKKTARLAERYISMVTIPVIVVLIVFVKPVINIMLTSAFFPAIPIFIVLLFFMLLSDLNVPYMSLISGINKPQIIAKIGIVTWIINIVLNYLFVPRDGILSWMGINGPTGSAIATLISCVFAFVSLRLAAKKLIGIQIIQIHTPMHLFAGTIMGVAIYFLSLPFIQVVRWYDLPIFALVGLGIYLAILFILKEFTKKDFMFFLNLMYPKEVFKYIKSELKKN